MSDVFPWDMDSVRIVFVKFITFEPCNDIGHYSERGILFLAVCSFE